MFDFTDDKPQDNKPLEPGTYLFRVAEAEVKETKAKNGKYIKLAWKVVDGPFEGRKIYEMFNIENTNAQAAEIGRGQLRHVINCLGMDPKFDSITEFSGKECAIKVKMGKDQNGNTVPKVAQYLPGNEFNQTPSSSVSGLM